MQAVPNVLPVVPEALSLGREEELLQGLIEFPDGLFFRDSFVALEALHDRPGGRGHGIGKFGLPTPRRAFHQKRFLHLRREIHDFERHWLDHVPGGSKPFRQLTS